MSELTLNAVRLVLERAHSELEYADTYGEPGYTDPERGILFANWNKVSRALCDRLEAQGYALEWSDEWHVDYDRSPIKAYRTSPDSHGWESRVRYCDGYVLTPDDDVEEWLADSLNDNRRPLPSWFDESELESRGFAVLEGRDKEVGFYPGQNDEPQKFTPALTARGLDFVLQITGRGQFDVAYRVWTRKVQS